MLKFSDLTGVIFDVDDTLLNNFPPGEKHSLHFQSRVVAAHEVGKRHGIKALENFTEEQCMESFRRATVAMIHGVVWQMLVLADVVSENQQMDFEHPLLKEIVELKEELHEDLLRTKGREVDGAGEFVALVAENGLKDKIAIASTANRRDIKIFLEATGLNKFFPKERIISREKLTHAKPHPEAYNLAFATLDLPESARAKVAAFEDDPRGIMSAKAAGLFVCAITTVHKRQDLAKLAVPPDLIADSYAEFTELLGFDVPKHTH